MPFNKELKKFTKKIKRETGRIVKQTGNFIEDLTDNTKLENLGKSIAKEGERIVTKENEKLKGSTASSSSIAASILASVPTSICGPATAASIEVFEEEQVEPKKYTQEDIEKIELFFNKHSIFNPIPSAPPASSIMLAQTAPPAPLVSREAESVNSDDDASDIKSISTSSYSSSILFHQNQELQKRVDLLEARLEIMKKHFANPSPLPEVLTLRLQPR